MKAQPLKGKLKWLCFAAVLSLVLAATPAPAQVADVVFYELTENMSVQNGTRIGTGSLMGTAKIGSPMCPDVLMRALIAAQLIGGSFPCTITAFGTDHISLLAANRGSGDLNADIAVVAEADNPADAPEYVVMTGRVTGKLQVIDQLNRLIAISGTFTPDSVFGYPASAFGIGPSGFTGKVRLPFVKDDAGSSRRPRRAERAFYLGDDGRAIRVQPDEDSLGRATARFELNFAAPAPTE